MESAHSAIRKTGRLISASTSGAFTERPRPITMRCALCFFLMCGALLQAQVTSTNPLTTITRSDCFTIYGGFGVMSPEAKAVGALCNETNATEVFESLLKQKSPVQQLYGLLGLQLVNAPQFKERLPAFADDKTKVRSLAGCIMGTFEVQEIARQIRDGRWQLRPEPIPGGKYEFRIEQR